MLGGLKVGNYVQNKIETNTQAVEGKTDCSITMSGRKCPESFVFPKPVSARLNYH